MDTVNVLFILEGLKGIGYVRTCEKSHYTRNSFRSDIK